MIYFVLLVFLSILVIAALWWKPGKLRASLPAAPSVFAPAAPAAPASQVERDIVIIADMLRADEAARERAAAVARLKSLQDAS